MGDIRELHTPGLHPGEWDGALSGLLELPEYYYPNSPERTASHNRGYSPRDYLLEVYTTSSLVSSSKPLPAELMLLDFVYYGNSQIFNG